MAKAYRQPNLENVTDSGLVEMIQSYREKIAEAKFYDGFYSEALKARRNGRDSIEGEKYVAMFTTTIQERLDTTALKNDAANNPLLQDIVKQYTKPLNVTQLRFKELANEPATTADAIIKAISRNPKDLLKAKA
jgi:hypothetical protein